MIPKTALDRRIFAQKELISNLPKTPFINGIYVPENSLRYRLPILDPFSQETLCHLEEAGAEDVRQAVSCANDTYNKGVWSKAHPRERGKVLARLADIIDSQRETLALLEAVDTGKRYAGTLGWDIPNAAEVYRYYSGLADKILGEYYPPVDSYRFHSQLEPVGVVAAIMPWNFPFACLAWKLGPALAAGCSVVVKSAERAPLSVHYFGHLASLAGFPEGVINILPGRGETTGAALITNHFVRKITFTGSTDTGVEIIKKSASFLPRLSLELGGKSPNVIMDGCNLDRAISGSISAILDVAGQNCLAGSRTFVHRNVYDEFVEKLKQRVQLRKLGDNLDDMTDQGPQIDIDHVNRIKGFVDRSKVEGASIIAGGNSLALRPTFYEPTLIECSRDDMEIVKEEVFGPVGCLLKFSDLDEAVTRANNSHYGLAAAIWTGKSSEADFFKSKIQAGTVWVNCYGIIDTVAPWGGVRLSGYGKELGIQAVKEFMDIKVVYTDTSV